MLAVRKRLASSPSTAMELLQQGLNGVELPGLLGFGFRYRHAVGVMGGHRVAEIRESRVPGERFTGGGHRGGAGEAGQDGVGGSEGTPGEAWHRRLLLGAS